MLILLVAGLLIGVIFPNVCAADYFPLKAGNVWVYYPSYGQGYRVDSIVGTEMVGETLTYIWERLEAPPDNYHERRWLAKDGVDLKALQYWSNEAEPPLGEPVLLDPPWLLGNIDNPNVGDSWQIEISIGTTQYRASFWVESITDTVTVPAGTFRNCIKVRQLDEITVSGFTTYNYRRYWLAPDIGPVKYTKYSNNWEQIDTDQKLVAYSLVPGEFPIATTPGWEMSAGAAFDGTNYLVGIEGDANRDNSITAQLVSQSGTLVGPRISVVGRTGGSSGVAFDGTNYLMVWDDDTLCNTIGDVIYGQLISKSGTLIGSPFPISPQTGNNSLGLHFRNMNIIFDGTNYFVVWDHSPTPCQNGCTDEYGQFVTPSGTLLGGPIKINTTPCGGGGAAAAFDGTNILVAWGSEWNASGTQSVCWTDSSGDHCDIANIWGQFITKSSAGTPGTLSGSNFLISAASVLYDVPSFAFDGTNYLVIFAQETTRPDTCPLSGCKWDVYGQLVTKAGAPIGSRITISDTSPNHFCPSPVFNGTNYLVTWTEGFGSTEATVKGRFFDKSGGPVGSEFALFSPSGGRVPWAAFTLFDGSKYFSVINRGTPGIDPYDEDAYTNQDVYGAFIKITIAQSVTLISDHPSLTNPGPITTDGVNLYVGNGNSILFVPIGGGAATTLYASVSPCCVSGITHIGTDLFWIDPNGDPDATAIFRVPASGSGPVTKIYSGFATGEPIVDGADIATDGVKLYTTDYVQGRVHSLNPDGSGITFLGSRYGGYFDTEHYSTITESGGILYIADSGNRPDVVPAQVVTIPKSGGSFTQLFAGAPFVRLTDIAVGNDTIFIADQGANTIWSLPITGGAPTALVSGPPFVQIAGLTFFDNALYVTDTGNAGGVDGPGAIYKVSFGVQVTETISSPSTPTGPTSGTTGTSYSYSTGGSTSNLGHSVQYQFDWGDGSNSGWLPVGTTSASHPWSSAGNYPVKTQARCTTDTSVVSSWSGALSVTISQAPPPPTSYTLTTSVNPAGAGTVIPSGGTYGAGTIVTLTATANSGYSFSSWTGLGPGDTSNGNIATIIMSSNKTVTANFSSGSSTATRNLPNCYTPSVTSTVTISVTPSGTTNSYAVEDVPPSGWAVGPINEWGLWDDVNKKVKWGPFFDHNTRTLTYQVTPPVGETGTKSFSGAASFDGVSATIGGDSTIDSCSFHPADTNHDYRIVMNEVTAYGSAWKTGQNWPTPPNPIPIEYVTNAVYLWKMGEVYHYDGSASPPWVPGAASIHALTSQTTLQIPIGLGTGSATRTLPSTYEPSVVVSVSISINPGQGTQGYAVEETPPNGWVVSDINESGQWDSVNKKVKWGPFFDANNRTLTYKAVPPVGETGTKTFSGTASFDGTNVTISGSSSILRKGAAIPDFNGDGQADILWRNKTTGQNVVWFMNGTTYGSYAWLLEVTDLNWEIVGTGDFNGDGKIDILWRNKGTGQNVVWFMDGVAYGSYAWLLEVADLNWEIVGTGDFNGDGKIDILWRNKGTGQNVVWFMDGATMSDWSWILPEVPDTNWEIVGPGDFNGDGKTDILWRNKATGQNVVWFMNGATLSSYSWIDTVADTNWEIVGTGDFNGDGKTDILWRNKNTGQNVVWLMNGTALSSYTWLPDVPDTNWEIVGPK